MRFDRYVALGDSMSIDRYPSVDLMEDGIGVLSEAGGPEFCQHRWYGELAPLPIGAASLLRRNADELWPDFQQRDLESRWSSVQSLNLAMDGATIDDVMDLQLPHLHPAGGSELVTLTVGGNDLLVAYGDAGPGRALDRAADRIIRDYQALVDAIHDQLPEATVVLTTVYDPSDGTGHIPGFHEQGDPLPLRVLERVNDAIRGTARARRWTPLADAYAHFQGHGALAHADGQWYWSRSMIEPGARGASELRRLWLEAVGG